MVWWYGPGGVGGGVGGREPHFGDNVCLHALLFLDDDDVDDDDHRRE